jgi:drug/metabolite transporter (DMT)-like permease
LPDAREPAKSDQDHLPMQIHDIRGTASALPSNLKGAAMLMIAAALLTVMTVFIKLLGSDLHIMQILFVRQVFMSAIVLPQILRGFPGSLSTSTPGLQLIRIACALVAMTCGFTAVIHLPLADATALGFAKSFFITIFAIFILAETVGPRRWLAVAAGFAGVAMMMQPGTESFSFYGLMALVGAAGAGLVMVLIRLMSRTEKLITILSWQAVGVGIATAIPAIYFWQWPTANEWLLLTGLGVVSYVAQMSNIMAYKWGEASLLASLDYVRLLYATLFGWWLFASLPGWNTWIGAGIIVAASIYMVWREARRHQQLTRSPHGRGYTT